jgi:hypothetical protein
MAFKRHLGQIIRLRKSVLGILGYYTLLAMFPDLDPLITWLPPPLDYLLQHTLNLWVIALGKLHVLRTYISELDSLDVSFRTGSSASKESVCINELDLSP